MPIAVDPTQSDVTGLLRAVGRGDADALALTRKKRPSGDTHVLGAVQGLDAAVIGVNIDDKEMAFLLQPPQG